MNAVSLWRRELPSLMLVLTTLTWGISFPWMKEWQDSARGCPGGTLVASLTVIGLRMTLAAAVLFAFRPGLTLRATRAEHGVGAAVGAAFALGFVLQVWGLAYTTPSLSAFFTCLCSGWVPLAAWAVFRTPPSPWTGAGLAVGLGGMAVLVEGGWGLGRGETLTLLASVFFAAQMLLLDRLGGRVRSAYITPAFLGVTAVAGLGGATLLAEATAGLAAWHGWVADMLRTPAVLRNLLCLAVIPTVLGFHWMNTYQPRVSASRAALIYLLEPPFAAAFSVLLGYDNVTFALLTGGALILAGNALAELPRLLPRAAASFTGGLTPRRSHPPAFPPDGADDAD